MAITTKHQRQQRRSEALQLIADGVPPTDAATQLTVKWGCSRRTSLRDIELAQSELANALNSVELQHMVGWLATQYQRLAAKAERDGLLWWPGTPQQQLANLDPQCRCALQEQLVPQCPNGRLQQC